MHNHNVYYLKLISGTVCQWKQQEHGGREAGREERKEGCGMSGGGREVEGLAAAVPQLPLYSPGGD